MSPIPIANDKTAPLRERMGFFISPAVEMVASLHVLSDPYHHDNTLEWALKAHQKLSAPLKKELDFFSVHYNEYSFVMDIVSSVVERDDEPLDEIIRKIDEMSMVDFALMFFGTTMLESEDVETWLNDPSTMDITKLARLAYYIYPSEVEEFFRVPEQMRRRLLTTLSGYWREFFAQEWEHVRPVLIKYVDEQKLTVAQLNPSNYLSTLVRNRFANADPSAYEQLESKIGRFEQHGNIRIFPSVFTAPHNFYTASEEKMTLYMNLEYYLANDYYNAVKNQPPQFMIDSLSALSDPTRMKIVKMLSVGERTTKDISEELSFTPATISQHLKILRDARIVKSKKQKNYVFYSLIHGAIEDTYRLINIYLKS